MTPHRVAFPIVCPDLVNELRTNRRPLLRKAGALLWHAFLETARFLSTEYPCIPTTKQTNFQGFIDGIHWKLKGSLYDCGHITAALGRGGGQRNPLPAGDPGQPTPSSRTGAPRAVQRHEPPGDVTRHEPPRDVTRCAAAVRQQLCPAGRSDGALALARRPAHPPGPAR